MEGGGSARSRGYDKAMVEGMVGARGGEQCVSSVQNFVSQVRLDSAYYLTHCSNMSVFSLTYQSACLSCRIGGSKAKRPVA